MLFVASVELGMQPFVRANQRQDHEQSRQQTG